MCVSVTCVSVCMSVLSDDVKCILTERHDQKKHNAVDKYQCISVRKIFGESSLW